MSRSQRTYSPAEVNVNWSEFVPIRDFAEGTAIEFQRNVDNSMQSVGMQGDVGLTYVPNNTGTVTFTIMQTGETNQILSSAQLLQDSSGKLIRGDIICNDPSGSTLVIARRCHIMTPASIALGDDQNPKTWTFYSEDMTYLDLPKGLNGSAEAAARVSSAVNGLVSASEALDALLR